MIDRQQYELKLAASDNLKENYTTVVIHVKDVNDNPPVFERPTYRTQITEEDDRNLPKRVLQVRLEITTAEFDSLLNEFKRLFQKRIEWGSTVPGLTLTVTISLHGMGVSFATLFYFVVFGFFYFLLVSLLFLFLCIQLVYCDGQQFQNKVVNTRCVIEHFFQISVLFSFFFSLDLLDLQST